MNEASKRIVVVGAGIVGMCTALQLCRRGHQVTIIDEFPPGEERSCSYGNAGVITPSAFPLGVAAPLRAIPLLLATPSSPVSIDWRNAPFLLPWFYRFAKGASPARLAQDTTTLHSLCSRALESYAALFGGLPKLIQTKGYLILHRSRQEAEKARQINAQRRTFGVKVSDLMPLACRELEPSLAVNFAGGSFIEEAANVLNPGGLVKGGLSEFLARGGEFVQDRVHQISRTKAGVNLRAASGEREFAAGVVATGAFANELLRQAKFNIPLISERGYHIDLQPGALDVGRPIAIPSLGSVITPTEAGPRLVGLSHFGLPHLSPREALIGRALRRVQSFMPAVEKRQGASVWSGQRPATPDSLPIIDRLPEFPELFFATGLGHVGLTLAAVVSELVSDLVLGARSPMLRLLSAQRFR